MISNISAATRLLVFLLASIAAQSATAPQALAWGDAGHRIVCQIAYLELKPDVREKVDALIALDPKFHTFAESCTWPDVFPPVRPAEHYLNVRRSAQTVDAGKLCPTAGRCVATAILDDARDLALSIDAADRLRLLKSLGHWVGDIHQPFHVSFEDDKGGNFIDVTGLCALSLHLAWDICIIEKKLGGDDRAIAAELESEVSDAERSAWAAAPVDAAAIAAWATESLSLVTCPSVQYCFQHGDACWYSPDEPQFTGKKRTVEMTDSYLEEHGPVVRDRLKRAGVRLAAILNTIFAK